jgi:hypothetical protein
MVSCRRFPVGTDKKDAKPRQAEPVSTRNRTDNLLNGNRMHCRLVILIQCRRYESAGSAGNRDCGKAVLGDTDRE